MPNFINDDFMQYNIDLHMYELTLNAVNRLLIDENLTELELDNLRLMIRNDFYSECLDYAIYRDKYLHYLSLPENRPYIQEAQTMMFQDMIIHRSTPGLAFSAKDVSLVTPRTRKYMIAMKLLLKQGLAENSKFHVDIKGVDW